MTARSKVDFGRIWPLQAAAALLLVAGGLHFTLTPAHGQTLGFSEGDLGLIGSSYYAGFLAGSLVNPLVFRRLGHRGLFASYAVLIGAAIAGQALLPYVHAWMLLRGVAGICAAGMFATIESWLHGIATNANRGRTLSLYSMSNQAALASGQYLFTLFPSAAGTGFYVASGILLTTALPLAAMRAAPPAAPSRLRIRIAVLAKASPVAFAGFLANGMATAPFWVLGPVFARDSGFDQFWVGVFMSLPILAALATQWPIARLSDGVDRRLVLLPVALGAACWAAVVATGSAFHAHWAIYAGIVLFGATAFLVNMLSSAHMNDRVEATDLTEAAGASFVVYGAASALGPITASAAMAALGPAGLFWHAGAVLLALGLFTATRIAVRGPAQV